MKTLRILTAFACIGLLPLTAQAETIQLTSLEWPPYTGSELPQQGASMAVVDAAFDAMGHDLEVQFLPWQRAVDQAQQDNAIAGYFPEYYAESLEEDFIFSDSIGTGPLGLVENMDQPMEWSSLDDLTDHTIGTVSGYVNTAEFDAMAERGEIETQPVTNDATNLRKVAGGRIPLAVIDSNVFDYLVSDQLSNLEGKLQMNDKLLEQKELYVAFSRNDQGERMAEILNKGLKKIDQEKIMKDALQRIMN
ncbi:transporter substrate-binding domain-containing protein [Salicola sp. Rm-C-2C1-2]|uniref:substrate-binding periplasmic protein n=1 Tax=Salicola sp. Rm-C-2C1-2 TaxID=3141321 RepID=UPI0032E4E016